jgi:hypothetical protein
LMGLTSSWETRDQHSLERKFVPHLGFDAVPEEWLRDGIRFVYHSLGYLILTMGVGRHFARMSIRSLVDDLKTSRILCEKVTKMDICLSTGSAV